MSTMAQTQFKLSKKDCDEMIIITDKLDRVLRKHRRLPAAMILSRLLPSLWCMMSRFENATEALDKWRILNVEMEDWIKQHFVKLHYPNE